MSASTQELGHQPHPWGETTDPSVHDPENFRYLVHAINPFSSMNAMRITLLDARDGITYDESWGDQKISMYDEPERVAERVSLSMSLIDQEHTATWGGAGLIIEAPEENIVLTSETDAGSHNNHLDFLHDQGSGHGVMSASDLLTRTSPHSYNEVVAVANRDGSKLQVKGFFYKVTSKGEPIDRKLAQRMTMHANRLGLPVIELTIENRFANNAVHRGERLDAYTMKKHNYVTIDFNGKQYYVIGHNRLFQFMVADETESRHFAAPHEFEAAISYAVSVGEMSEQEADETLKAYAEADRKRRTPTAYFDEKDGSFKNIEYYEGYGDSEYRITLGKTGHGYRTHVQLSNERARESMLNAGRSQIIGEDMSWQPISPYKADEMVTKACEQLDDVKASQLQQWYSEHKSVLEKQWEYHMQRRRSLGGMSLVGSTTERWTPSTRLSLNSFGEKPTYVDPNKFTIKKDVLPGDIIGLLKPKPDDTDKQFQ